LNITGIGKLFWNKPAARPDCHPTHGSKAQPSKPSRRRFSGKRVDCDLLPRPSSALLFFPQVQSRADLPDGIRTKLPETCLVNVLQVQDRFAGVLPCSSIVVVPGPDVHSWGWILPYQNLFRTVTSWKSSCRRTQLSRGWRHRTRCQPTSLTCGKVAVSCRRWAEPALGMGRS
jgi:hypothetical protein